MLKAGFARVDVTPPLGTYIAGYFHSRFADGILDPIELNAIAFNDGSQTAIIITADFEEIGEKEFKTLRKLIVERTGINENNIIITSLHQHSSISFADGMFSAENNVLQDFSYVQLLQRKFADVAQMAIDDMEEATLSYGEEQTEKPISFVRRYFMSDGTVATNPKPDKVTGWPPVKSTEEADNTVRLVKFTRTGKKDIALVNFCSHSDTIGGSKFSADWAGFTRRFVEKDQDAHCVLIVGFQGDTNHINFLVDNDKRFPKGPLYPHSEYMGRMIANTVNKIWDKTKKTDDFVISGNNDVVYSKTRTDKDEFFDECWEVYKERMLNHNYNVSDSPSGIPMAEAHRIVRVHMQGKLYSSVVVSIIKLGNIYFFGLSGEPFTQYANSVRKAFPDKTIISICIANGPGGYFPTATAFEVGGYEVVSSAFTPDIEKQLVDAAIDLIKNM